MAYMDQLKVERNTLPGGNLLGTHLWGERHFCHSSLSLVTSPSSLVTRPSVTRPSCIYLLEAQDGRFPGNSDRGS
jgi:hypothetical protein